MPDDARARYIASLGSPERDPGRLDRLKSFWDALAASIAPQLRGGYDPMAAWGMLGQGGYGRPAPGYDTLKLLQLGNEIGAEQGQGRDPQVIQLIQALLGQQRR